MQHVALTGKRCDGGGGCRKDLRLLEGHLQKTQDEDAREVNGEMDSPTITTEGHSSDVGGRGISAILILLLGIDMFLCDFNTRKGSGELARCELLAAFNLFVTDHPRSRSTNHEWEK